MRRPGAPRALRTKAGDSGGTGKTAKPADPAASAVMPVKSAVTPQQIAARGGARPINLALQGGGAHGAFTWGVLDRLLEDETLCADAVSATSAGAMNAVVMAHGMSLGGRDGAKAKLEEFWRAVSRAGSMFSPIKGSWEQIFPLNAFSGAATAGLQALQALVTQTWSPAQLNPFDFNPLKDVLRGVVDFEHLQTSPHATRLFISATNVRTGKVRVFENAEVTLEAVLASACLPTLFKAVEIDGEAYWDGGYMGNPALFPLFYKGASPDVVIVHINPLVREHVPDTAPEILDRMNEISFNSSLLAELRAVAFVARLVDAGAVEQERYKHIRVHSIADDDEMIKHGVATKSNPEWSFLCHLRDAGRRAADKWLIDNAGNVGTRSSVDITRFL